LTTSGLFGFQAFGGLRLQPESTMGSVWQERCWRTRLSLPKHPSPTCHRPSHRLPDKPNRSTGGRARSFLHSWSKRKKTSRGRSPPEGIASLLHIKFKSQINLSHHHPPYIKDGAYETLFNPPFFVFCSIESLSHSSFSLIVLDMFLAGYQESYLSVI